MLTFQDLTGSARTAAENLSLQVELANQQILSVVNAFAAAAEGSGVGAADAFEAAIKSVAEEIKVQAATNSTLDLSDQAQLAEIKLNIEAKVDTLALTDTSIRTTEFAATMSETVKATGLVNAKIQDNYRYGSVELCNTEHTGNHASFEGTGCCCSQSDSGQYSR